SRSRSERRAGGAATGSYKGDPDTSDPRRCSRGGGRGGRRADRGRPRSRSGARPLFSGATRRQGVGTAQLAPAPADRLLVAGEDAGEVADGTAAQLEGLDSGVAAALTLGQGVEEDAHGLLDVGWI